MTKLYTKSTERDAMSTVLGQRRGPKSRLLLEASNSICQSNVIHLTVSLSYKSICSALGLVNSSSKIASLNEYSQTSPFRKQCL